MTDWAAVEQVLVEWVSEELELPLSRVIWQEQNVPQPDYPYLAMKRDNFVRVGGARDEIRTSTDLTAPQGEEVTLTSVGVREFTLNITAHVDEPSGANKPNCNAPYLLTKLQSSLGKNGVSEKLCLAGLGVIEELPVSDISSVGNGVYVSRASFDVRFRTVDAVAEEKVGYIDTVKVSTLPGCALPAEPFEVTTN